ncbi:hypothetical protein HPB50_020042 [Hyalomma asiaticum]|uniref:Uncharacterized protein n=1 Tax=Hyalomma asiaticum TaxID=266040 RepID=A0ACB7SN75_HYAAI|nr:hypothetical protein HPB50_020042 [Hyalomma asiaticum]
MSSPSRVTERSLEERSAPIDLTPVHQRCSRRLRGEAPEFSALSDPARTSSSMNGNATDMTSQIAPAHIVAISTFDTEEDFNKLCIADDDVTIPPRSSMCVAVTNRAFSDLEGIADSNTRLILEKGICMARGLVQLRDGCANVLITNFGNEVQHLAKGTVIASLNDFVHVSELSIPEAPTPDLQDVDSVLASINIETGLLPSQKEEIESLSSRSPQAECRVESIIAECKASSSG